jgi:hypothetical protein
MDENEVAWREALNKRSFAKTIDFIGFPSGVLMLKP